MQKASVFTECLMNRKANCKIRWERHGLSRTIDKLAREDKIKSNISLEEILLRSHFAKAIWKRKRKSESFPSSFSLSSKLRWTKNISERKEKLPLFIFNQAKEQKSELMCSSSRICRVSGNLAFNHTFRFNHKSLKLKTNSFLNDLLPFMHFS